MTRYLAACGVLLAGLALVQGENWPQWRGPNNDGISSEKKLPAEWSATKNMAWTFDLPGRGCSTPVVWGERIFLTTQDGDDVALLAISTAGKQLWKQNLGEIQQKLPARGDEGSDAAPSPTTDGKHVWAFVGNGTLACFTVEGKEVWKLNLQDKDKYGKFKIAFGMSSTPVLYKDRLYLQLIHTKPGLVVCLDAKTGKEVWKIERKSDGKKECLHSYASPFLWKKGNDAYLVVHGNDHATGHKLSDGSEIWRVEGLNPKDSYNLTLRFVASPVCTPDLIVVPSAKGGPVVALKPDAKGAVTKGSKSELWRLAKGTPDVPSPVVHDGLVYLCGAGGGLTCLDAKTGKQVYNNSTHRARYRASPVYADGKIYLTARDGTVTVVQAGKEFKVLATNKLSDDLAGSPAVSGGRIYLRGFKKLYAIEAKGK